MSREHLHLVEFSKRVVKICYALEHMGYIPFSTFDNLFREFEVPDEIDFHSIRKEVFQVIKAKEEWQFHALEGKKIHAIKAYRTQYGTTLRQSKDAVEKFIGKVF